MGGEQMSLELGSADRDRGMEAALGRVSADWAEHARVAIAVLAGSGAPFTADDLVAAVGLPPSGSPNAVGALFGGASRQGLIQRVGDARARRRARHAGRVSVWAGVQ